MKWWVLLRSQIRRDCLKEAFAQDCSASSKAEVKLLAQEGIHRLKETSSEWLMVAKELNINL